MRTVVLIYTALACITILAGCSRMMVTQQTIYEVITK